MSEIQRPAVGSAVDNIVEFIRQRVLGGSYGPGHRLIEADITAELSVSRGPLREAFRRLSAEGLIELTPHRGARIRRLDVRELGDAYDLREVLEGFAAARAALKARSDPVFARDVRDLQAELQRLAAEGDLRAYAGANAEFHELILSAAANVQLTGLVRGLQGQTMRVLLPATLDLHTVRTSNQEHAAISAAIAAGNAGAAEAAMRAHIRRSRSVIEMTIASSLSPLDRAGRPERSAASGKTLP